MGSGGRRMRSLEIVIAAGTSAFGAGTHPTTRTCLELLLGLEPAGSFADLGCGSGVLGIVAATLGFAPVTALDIEPEAVQAAARNARTNGVGVRAQSQDLAASEPPPADVVASNFPSWLHELVGPRLSRQVQAAIVSGFGPRRPRGCSGPYESAGLRCRRRLDPQGWVVALLGRD